MIAHDSSRQKMKHPFCVGLTGGIGSGKTTVAKLFEAFGVPIIDADVIAHEITKPTGPAYKAIVSHFGKSILNEDQTIHRKQLRERIFNNPAERVWLEQLQHPMIRQIMRDQIAQVAKPYCICVIPLLAESRGIEFIDRVLVVDTPIHIQQERAAIRDAVSAQSIQKIVDTQANHAARLAIADDVIINNSTLLALEKQVAALHQQYLHLSR